MMNGDNDCEFNLLVSSRSRREVVKIQKEATLQKALEPLLKKWGLWSNKVSFQLRYYRYDLKPDTLAGDTEGTEVYVTKDSEPADKELEGFHPFTNKASLKSSTEEYVNRNGWYLARESSSANGQFSLAVTFADQLRHFKINFSSVDGTYKVASKPFNDLHELFEYYRTHCIKKTTEGDIYLLHPIPKERKAENGRRPSTHSIPVETVQNGFNNQSNRPLPALPGSPSPLSQPNNLPSPSEPIMDPRILVSGKGPSIPPTQVKPSQPVSRPKMVPTKPKELFSNVAPPVSEMKSRNSKTLPRGKKISKEEFQGPQLSSKDIQLSSRPLPPIPPNENGLNHVPNLHNPVHNSVSKPVMSSKPPMKSKPSLTINTQNDSSLNKSWNNLSDISPGSNPSNWKQNNFSPIPNLPPKHPTYKPNSSNGNGEELPEVPSRNNPHHKQSPPSPAPTSNLNTIEPNNFHPSKIANNQEKVTSKKSVPNPPVMNGTGPPSDDTLPPNWIEVYSNSRGRVYYFNQVTAETRWSRPLAGREAANKLSNNPANKPRAVSPTIVSSDVAPVSRQRSNTVSSKSNRESPPPPLPITKSFSPVDKLGNRPPNGLTNGNTRANIPPEPSAPKNVRSQSFRNKVEKNNEYDYLPGIESSSEPNSNQAQPHKSVQPTRPAPPSPGCKSPPASNRKQPTKITQAQNFPSKQSAPVNSCNPTGLSQGKPVKVRKHTIPAPPPDIPPMNHSSTPTCTSTPSTCRPNIKSAGKSNTMPSAADLLPRDNLLASIRNNPTKLKQVSPSETRKKLDESSKSNLLEIIKRRMENRKNAVQDSDPEYEDADDDDGDEWDDK